MSIAWVCLSQVVHKEKRVSGFDMKSFGHVHTASPRRGFQLISWGPCLSVLCSSQQDDRARCAACLHGAAASSQVVAIGTVQTWRVMPLCLIRGRRACWLPGNGPRSCHASVDVCRHLTLLLRGSSCEPGSWDVRVAVSSESHVVPMCCACCLPCRGVS